MKAFKPTYKTNYTEKFIIKNLIKNDVSKKLITNLLEIKGLSKIGKSKMELANIYFDNNNFYDLFDYYEDIYIAYNEYFLKDIKEYNKLFIESYIENFKSPSQRELLEQLPFIFEKSK